ncbi:MAG: hypothetical protein ACE5IH_09760 [Thermodesulfobacteriota bacterium]
MKIKVPQLVSPLFSPDGQGRVFDNIFVERLWRSVKYEYGVKYPGGAFMILIGFIVIPVVWRKR